MSMGMRRLVGKTCQVVFSLPSSEWPFSGYPAWVVIIDVDMPMVLMSCYHAGNDKWVNAADIKMIREDEQ